MKDTSTKSVLFVCVGNTCRSQMAAAIINDRLKGRWFAVSGGIHIGQARDDRTRLVLEEIGIHAEVPAAAHINHHVGTEFDLIITLADKVQQAVMELFPTARIRHQHIDDPFADEDGTSGELTLSRHRQARDEIIEKVLPLMANV